MENKEKKRKKRVSKFTRHKRRKTNVDNIEELISLHWYNAASVDQLKRLAKHYDLDVNKKTKWEIIKVLRDHRQTSQVEIQHLLHLSRLEKKQKEHFFSRVGFSLDLLLHMARFLSLKDVVSLGSCCKFLSLRLSLSTRGIPSIFMSQGLESLRLNNKWINANELWENIMMRCCKLKKLGLSFAFPTKSPKPFCFIESSLVEISFHRIDRSFCEILEMLKNCHGLERLSITDPLACALACDYCDYYLGITHNIENQRRFLKDSPWFPHLSSLRLQYDASRHCLYDINWHRHMPNLTQLTLEGEVHFQAVNFPHLTMLNLLQCDLLIGSLNMDVSDCKKLQTLLLNSRMTRELQHVSPSLNTLFMNGNFEQENVYKQVPKLKHLTMTYLHDESHYKMELAYWFTLVFGYWKELETLTFYSQNDLESKSIETALTCILITHNPSALKFVKIQNDFLFRQQLQKEQFDKLVKKYNDLASHLRFQITLAIGSHCHRWQ